MATHLTLLVRMLAMAIAMVIGLQVTPLPATHGTTTPVVCSFDQSPPDDALKVGERLEPRVFPAPFLDRLPRVAPAAGLGSIAPQEARLVALANSSDRRSDGDPRPIVKHVPRMERGDPPRI
jgi:hypothetical protein